jgi:putative ABC transport system permease protein
MTGKHDPLALRLCLWLVRLCSALVPSRDRADWRKEWEGELRHRRDLLESRNRFDRSHQVDLLRRTLGAFPDAAWLRRQLTLDADIVHDVRHGVRMLWKSPGFTIAAVFILAVGIGSTVAVVTLLDTLMFKPLPYGDAERVMTLWQRRASGAGELEAVAPANFLDWRLRAQSFTSMAAVIPYSYDYTGGGEPEVLFGAQVTEGFWDVLGMPPALGRAFSADEHADGGRRVVVISHRLWQRKFGGDPGIIGQALRMDGEAFTVVGVLPATFEPQLLPRPDALEVWTPKVVRDLDRRIRASAWWNAIGRLKPGVTREQANAELAQISAALESENPRTNAGLTAVAVPMREHLMGDVQTPLLVMLGAVILVLGIGCANVASLLLARGMGREREFAIRSAMGAGRGRLVRQLVTESLLLSGVAAAAGIALAHWGVSAIVALAPGGVLRLQEAAIDGRTLLFAGALTSLTAIAFGLLPAVQFSRPASDAMRDRSGGGAPRRHFRRGLVAAEVAFALVLLTGAGLLIRSFQRLTSVDPGFSPRNVVVVQVFAYDRNPTPERVRAFFNATLERLRALPGVQAVGAVSAMPFTSANIDIKSTLDIVGRPAANEREQRGTYVTIAAPGYFDAMSIPLRAGRLLSETDTERAPIVAVISDALRRREFPSEDPLGKRLVIQWQGERVEAEVVGVVSQIRHDSLDSAPRPEVFLPLAQLPFASMTYVLRGSVGSSALIDAAKREIWAVDPLQTFYETASVERLVSASVVRQRFSMTLMSAFALVALVLCATGIYGVISFTTAQRTKEIGVRMALGASAPAIQRMVLREGAAVVGTGVLIGLAGSLAASRFLQALLFETEPGDPATVAAVSALIAVVGLAACYLPARRATHIDPVAALRDDGASP